jgi:uncharacterized membrane protein YpjA
MGVKLDLSLIEAQNRVKKNQIDAQLILSIFRQPILRISCASIWLFLNEYIEMHGQQNIIFRRTQAGCV